MTAPHMASPLHWITILPSVPGFQIGAFVVKNGKSWLEAGVNPEFGNEVCIPGTYIDMELGAQPLSPPDAKGTYICFRTETFDAEHSYAQISKSQLYVFHVICIDQEL